MAITAAHNDLTMANVLTSREGIGILDWEAAVADGLPMTDLWYALADAVSRAGRMTHERAVRPWSSGRARFRRCSRERPRNTPLRCR